MENSDWFCGYFMFISSNSFGNTDRTHRSQGVNVGTHAQDPASYTFYFFAELSHRIVYTDNNDHLLCVVYRWNWRHGGSAVVAIFAFSDASPFLAFVRGPLVLLGQPSVLLMLTDYSQIFLGQRLITILTLNYSRFLPTFRQKALPATFSFRSPFVPFFRTYDDRCHVR
jgi:hypothetical protein